MRVFIELVVARTNGESGLWSTWNRKRGGLGCQLQGEGSNLGAKVANLFLELFYLCGRVEVWGGGLCRCLPLRASGFLGSWRGLLG